MMVFFRGWGPGWRPKSRSSARRNTPEFTQSRRNAPHWDPSGVPGLLAASASCPMENPRFWWVIHWKSDISRWEIHKKPRFLMGKSEIDRWEINGKTSIWEVSSQQKPGICNSYLCQIIKRYALINRGNGKSTVHGWCSHFLTSISSWDCHLWLADGKKLSLRLQIKTNIYIYIHIYIYICVAQMCTNVNSKESNFIFSMFHLNSCWVMRISKLSVPPMPKNQGEQPFNSWPTVWMSPIQCFIFKIFFCGCVWK